MLHKTKKQHQLEKYKLQMVVMVILNYLHLQLQAHLVQVQNFFTNTTDIGRVNGIEIKDSSFDLDSSNPPDATFKANFIVKDPTGTFASGNTLTTHTGTVSGYDSDTQVLSTTFENVVRTKVIHQAQLMKAYD